MAREPSLSSLTTLMRVAPPSAASADLGSADRILLIEDNEDDAFFFRLLVRKAGISAPVQHASDGEQAIECLARCCHGTIPPPRVTFLDLKLPKRFGFEVLEWIGGQPALRELFKIVLSSSYEDRDVRQAYALGADGYLVKYPTPTDLAAIVAAAHLPRSARDAAVLPGVPRPGL